MGEKIVQEAYPVLFNIFLFAMMLYSVREVYNGKVLTFTHRRESIMYFYYSILLVLFTTFAFSEPDTYHYMESFLQWEKYGYIDFEPLHKWIADVVANRNFYLWRLLVWGTSSILTLLTIKHLRLHISVSFCFITLFYLLYLCVTRGNLGLSLLYYGLALLLVNINNISKLAAVFFIFISIFLHRSMIIAVLMLLIIFVKFNKKFVVISLLLFPFFVTNIDIVMNFISNIDLSSNLQDMSIQSKLNSYADEDRKLISNLNGLIRIYLQLLPLLLSIMFATKRIVFDKINVPTYIYKFFQYWYGLFYLAMIFWFQEMSDWLYIRIESMSKLALVIVLTYIYTNFKQTMFMRFLLYFQLLSCLFTLFYQFYIRL